MPRLQRHNDSHGQVQRRRRRETVAKCVCCLSQADFYWSCRCGFSICQTCMDENAWGMTCNFVTWVCPDCGGSNDYANK